MREMLAVYAGNELVLGITLAIGLLTGSGLPGGRARALPRDPSVFCSGAGLGLAVLLWSW